MKKNKNKKCSPILPTNFRVEFNGNDYILLMWDCERNPILDFIIYFGSAPDSYDSFSLFGDVRSFTASLLQNDTEYYFKLISRDSTECFVSTDVITGKTLET